jgi:hypothetical protein
MARSSDRRFVIVPELRPGLNQFPVGLRGDAVAHVRPVEPDDGDGPSLFVFDLCKIHDAPGYGKVQRFDVLKKVKKY